MSKNIVLKEEFFTENHKAVKSLIHLLNGKPDSATQAFDNKVIVRISDLKNLLRKVNDKINNYSSENLTSIYVSLTKRKLLEFNDYESFINYDWEIEERVRSIHLKWEFYITLPEYLAPQKHTLSVKVLSERHIADILPLVFSNDPEKHSKIEEHECTVIGRVDFINHTLGEELLNIVSAWNNTLEVNEKNYKTLKNISTSIFFPIFSLSIQMLFVILYISLINNYYDLILTRFSNEYILIAAIVSLIFIPLTIAVRVNSYTEEQAQKELSKIGGLPNIILTKGDEKQLKKQKDKRTGYFAKLFLEQFTGIALNIGVTYLVFK